jgi:hypothetical protein
MLGKSKHSASLLLVVVCAVLLSAFGARAQNDAIVLGGAIAVRSGDAAAGTGGGYFSGFTAVSLNGPGDLAFIATVTGGTTSQGVFVRVGGTTIARVVAGALAPGTGGTFSEFHSVSLNDSGDLAFEALATGTFWPEGSGEGVFRRAVSGSVTKVALGGEVAFANTRYARLGISEVALGNGGHVAFRSDLDGCPACSSGIFRDDGSQIQPVVLDGALFDAFGSLDVGPDGTVVFAGSRVGVGGVYTDSAGTPVSIQGDAAPETGGSYGPQTFCTPVSADLFASVDVNDAGQVAFRASYSGGTAPANGRNGLFLDTGGTDTAIVVWGSPVPGGGGGSFGCVSPLEGGVAINAAGTAAFWAAIGSDGDEGIFVRSGGTTSLVARRFGSVGTCSGYGSFSPSTVQIDDSGRVAFVTTQLGIADDADCDGIPDVLDKCMLDSRNVAMPCDTDQDGYGNVCDGDFNQSGFVNSVDFGHFFVPSLQTSNPSARGTDMNCSGSVTSTDFGMFFVPQFHQGSPGPSGLACAGTIPCN